MHGWKPVWDSHGDPVSKLVRTSRAGPETRSQGQEGACGALGRPRAQPRWSPAPKNRLEAGQVSVGAAPGGVFVGGVRRGHAPISAGRAGPARAKPGGPPQASGRGDGWAWLQIGPASSSGVLACRSPARREDTRGAVSRGRGFVVSGRGGPGTPPRGGRGLA